MIYKKIVSQNEYTMRTTKIEQMHINIYTVKQSKYQVVGTLPIRMIVLGPSGSGKTVLLQHMCLDLYKDSFSQNYL